MSISIPPIDIGSAGGAAFDIPPIDIGGATSGAPRKPPKVDTSSGSFLHGLLSDAETLIGSIPDLIVKTATRPWEIPADTVKGTAQFVGSFAPLARAGGNLVTGDIKDFRKFYDQYEQAFYAHPLGPTLGILGLGSGLGGRIGAIRGLPRGISDVDLRTPGAATAPGRSEALTRAIVLGHDTGPFTSGTGRFISVGLGRGLEDIGQAGEQIVTRSIGRSHMRANRAYAIDSLMKMLPEYTPVIGEAKRAARATRTEGRVPYLRLLSAPEYIDYQKTFRALTKSEEVAAGLRNKVPFASDVETWTNNLKLLGTDEAEALLSQLEDPAVRKFYMEGSKRIEAHEAAGRALEPVRREILMDLGALTAREAEAAPWRLTRQLRGANLATPSWLYKQRRKIDAQIRQIVGAKARLVPVAKAFGNKDRRATMKAARAASNEAIRESGYRARIFTRLNQEVQLPKGEPPVPGLARAKAAGLIDPEPETQRTVLQDIGQEVDDAYNEKESLRDDLDALMQGESTTAFMDKMGMTPQGGWGATEQAMAAAVHKALRKEHADELKALEALLALAKQRRLPARVLDAMGLRIPSDIRNPTPEELAKATELRAKMEAIKQRLKEAKRFKLTETEKASMRNTIDSMNKEILKLENPRALRRSPSSLKRQFESRYSQAEKKLNKQIAAKRKTLDEIGEEIGPIDNPNDYVHTAALGVMDRRYRKAVLRYERAVAAEYAHAQSVIRGLEAAERQANSAAEIKRLQELKIQFIQAQRVRLHDLNESIEDRVALKADLQSRLGELVGGGEPHELAAEARRTGRPQPYYTPDEMLKQQRNGRMGLAEGSILAQRRKADIYASRSILARTGALALHPDTLSPAYFRAAKHALNVAMHEQAMKLATRIAKDTPLPKNYEYLRRTPGETISETAKYRGEHLRAMEHEFGREEDISTKDDTPAVDFTDADGSAYRLIIPKSYADEFRAEGLNSQTMIRQFSSKMMDVWRSLVLHLRVPWLVNNVVGNTFLFAMRFAGLQGLTEVARMAASNPVSRKYIPAMRRLALEHLDAEQVREIFPEQVRGTHFETQAPDLPNVVPQKYRAQIEESPRGKRALQAAADVPRYLPRVDKAYERRLRQGATNAILRSRPEVQEIFRDMKRQGSGSFHDAVTKALEGNEHLRREVVQEVNDALGNFLSLTRAERSLLRRVVPFYAWMREITRISGRMLVDHPGRVLLLNQFAQATSEMQAEELPDYMRGTVNADKAGWLKALLGGGAAGTVGALNLKGASPYGTLLDEYSAARALFPGGNSSNVREFAGNFNPAINSLYNVSQSSRDGNLIKSYVSELLHSVPQAGLVDPYKSDLYPERSRSDILWKLLGDPRIHYSPDEASFQQFQGR